MVARVFERTHYKVNYITNEFVIFMRLVKISEISSCGLFIIIVYLKIVSYFGYMAP
jgi:hypothetical protein